MLVFFFCADTFHNFLFLILQLVVFTHIREHYVYKEHHTIFCYTKSNQAECGGLLFPIVGFHGHGHHPVLLSFSLYTQG